VHSADGRTCPKHPEQPDVDPGYLLNAGWADGSVLICNGGAVTPEIEQALATDRTIDITTTGRRSGAPRRIEIWFHRVDGRIYITGSPGTRDWYANLIANPTFTFHLKGSARADLAAVAAPVEGAEKARVLQAIADEMGPGGHALDVGTSPLVEVTWADAA
jgi:deazaflavin-dependent oxidoreductase (nitroreductase family)